MGDEILLPSADVAGGLWPGAVCQDQSDDAAIRAQWGSSLDGCHMLWCDRGVFFSENIALVLPGELGLGAAGLAARILHRIWPDLTVINTHRSISATVSIATKYGHIPRETVLDTVEVPEDARLEDWHWRHLAAVSRYLARLDRLCVAVGVPSPASEVPRWYWHGPLRCWILKHSGIDTHDHAMTFGQEHPGVSAESKPSVDHRVPGLCDGDPVVALDICLRDL